MPFDVVLVSWLSQTFALLFMINSDIIDDCIQPRNLSPMSQIHNLIYSYADGPRAERLLPSTSWRILLVPAGVCGGSHWVSSCDIDVVFRSTSFYFPILILSLYFLKKIFLRKSAFKYGLPLFLFVGWNVLIRVQSLRRVIGIVAIITGKCFPHWSLGRWARKKKATRFLFV